MRFVISLSVLLLALPARADDTDLQQYNRAAATVEAANTAAALTSPVLLVRDGKKITADSNGLGSAPINRSVKQVADYATGTRCAVQGNCASVNPRTVKSLSVDGTGGAVSVAAAGSVVATGALSAGTTLAAGTTASVATTISSTSKPTQVNPWGRFTKESAVFCYAHIDGSGTFLSGFNILDVSRASAGAYTMTCHGSPNATFAARSIPIVTADTAQRVAYVSSLTLSGADLVVAANTTNLVGAAADSGIYVVVWGGG